MLVGLVGTETKDDRFDGRAGETQNKKDISYRDKSDCFCWCLIFGLWNPKSKSSSFIQALIALTLLPLPSNVTSTYQLQQMATMTTTTTPTPITDKSSALSAVSLSGDSLMQCTGLIRNDRDVVLTAVRSHVDALLWASSELKEDKEIVLAAVTSFGRAIRYTQGLRSNRDIVLAAVTSDGNALQHVPRELRDDVEIVGQAIKSRPLALQYASESCRGNVELLVAAGRLNKKVLAAAASDEVHSIELVHNFIPTSFTSSAFNSSLLS